MTSTPILFGYFLFCWTIVYIEVGIQVNKNSNNKNKKIFLELRLSPSQENEIFSIFTSLKTKKVGK